MSTVLNQISPTLGRRGNNCPSNESYTEIIPIYEDFKFEQRKSPPSKGINAPIKHSRRAMESLSCGNHPIRSKMLSEDIHKQKATKTNRKPFLNNVRQAKQLINTYKEEQRSHSIEMRGNHNYLREAFFRKAPTHFKVVPLSEGISKTFSQNLCQFSPKIGNPINSFVNDIVNEENKYIQKISEPIKWNKSMFQEIESQQLQGSPRTFYK